MTSLPSCSESSSKPRNLREILVVHHTHTDYGYTSHPDVVEQQHFAFIDQALDLCRANEDLPIDRRFRWTCESSWIVYRYFQQRPKAQWKAFLQAVERADIEVAAMPLHPTPLADVKTIRASLKILEVLRAEGIPISLAMICDINGLNWPWAEALLEAGVEGVGTAMNFICGGGLARFTGFHWISHEGRPLLCWQGTHYNQGAYWGLNHTAYTTQEVAPDRVAELVDFPYEKLLLQVTNIPCDNFGPNPNYLAYIENYNRLAEDNGWPRMRPAFMREWFDFLQPLAGEFPSYRGEWSDWWASGVASTPRETAALREAQRRVGVVENTLGDSSPTAQTAREKIFLAAEHTWGSSTSITAPWQLPSVAGLAAKQNLVYQAAYAASELLGEAFGPDYALRDPQFLLGCWDPLWSEIVEGDSRLTVGEHSPFRQITPPGPAPDWEHWLGDDFGAVIKEQPADGQRSTWFVRGRGNRPETHGEWPQQARWSRQPFTEVQREFSTEGDVARLNLTFSIDTKGEPLAFYVQFPFLLRASEIRAEIGGTWADPREENIPGSCVNWWTVQGGILMVGEKASLLWTSWDAPLVMFDAICPNPPKKHNALSVPTLVSWVYHNYWGTNFAGVHQGEVTFRYRIKYWPKPISQEAANDYLQSDPLPQYPDVLRRNPNCSNEIPQNSALSD